MILLIDNYDSFVYNLARYFQQLGQETHVVRNDAIDAPQVRELAPQAIVLSPGPCTPDEAGCSLTIVRQLYGEFPILGVCLGHQAIAAALGARIVRASEPMHGRTTEVTHDEQGVFVGIPTPLTACRYHSLVVDPASLPECLEVSANSNIGEVMALRHRSVPVVGLQFHPEAILTEFGYEMLGNFLRLAGLAIGPLPCIQNEIRQSARSARPLPKAPVTF